MNKKLSTRRINSDRNLEISRVQEKLYKIPFEPIFDGELGDYLHNISARHSVCKEFVICPLLTGISHLMRNSFVTTLTTLSEQSIFYSALIANPSTGKSTGMSLVKKSLYEIEEYDKVPRKKSSLINAGTVEALLTNLETNPCLVSFFDESSTFMSSFGLYKGGDGKYDRSVYLELYTGPIGYDRSLTGGRHYIQMPRFNVCLLGHMSDYLEFVRHEKDCRDDGLIQRFHLCAPKPVYFKSSDMINTPPIKYSLTVLLFIISRLNSTPVNYNLDKGATATFYSIYDKYKDLSQKFGEKYDMFITALCGKSASQILRAAMFIHSFKKAFSIIKQIELSPQLNINTNSLNPRLEATIATIAKQPNSFQIISDETLKKAVNLVDYFNKVKMCFAEYEVIDYSMDFFKILESMGEKNNEETSDRYFSPKSKELAKKILMFPTDESLTFTINDLNQTLSNSYKKEDIMEVAMELQKMGLGSIIDENVGGVLKRPNTFFKKIGKSEIENNIEIFEKIENLGIKTSVYIEILEKTPNGIKNRKKARTSNLDDISNDHAKAKKKKMSPNPTDLDNSVNPAVTKQNGLENITIPSDFFNFGTQKSNVYSNNRVNMEKNQNSIDISILENRNNLNNESSPEEFSESFWRNVGKNFENEEIEQANDFQYETPETNCHLKTPKFNSKKTLFGTEKKNKNDVYFNSNDDSIETEFNDDEDADHLRKDENQKDNHSNSSPKVQQKRFVFTKTQSNSKNTTQTRKTKNQSSNKSSFNSNQNEIIIDPNEL